MEKIKHLVINGHLYFDGANTYHSCEIIVNCNELYEERFYVPMTYGYERQYIYSAIKLLVKLGRLPEETQSIEDVEKLGIHFYYFAKKCKRNEILKLKKYKCTFNGRLSSAIGETSKFKEVVEGVNYDDVRTKLYNKYEHITNLILK